MLTPLISFIGRLASIIVGALVSAISTGVSAFARIVGAVNAVIGAIRSCISWVGGLISKLSSIKAPGWLSRFFSEGQEGIFFGPVSPGGLVTAAAAPPPALMRLASPAMTASGGSVTNVNITVNGALDPIAVADQIKGIMNSDARIRGLTTAKGGSLWR